MQSDNEEVLGACPLQRIIVAIVLLLGLEIVVGCVCGSGWTALALVSGIHIR